MARHNIYVDEPTERVIELLGLAGDGYSPLFRHALTALLTQMPEKRVRRAINRAAREAGARQLVDLAPATDA